MDNESEFYEFEDRAYLKPTLSSGEQEAFINNLRDIQSQNNQQITTDTYNLGTAEPSNLGGLGGGEAYFNSRYQTPQVNEMVDTLKSAAQAQALNDVMSNYQNQLKQRYDAAYRNAQRRQRARARSYYNRSGSGGGSGGGNGNTSGWNGDVKKVATEESRDTISDAPIEGHNTTAFFDGANFVVYDETTGEYYVNGINRGKNPSNVLFKTPRTAAGGGGGGAW